jgi:prepilin-type N-terminal cleavage/methylation domain-containing protein
LIFLKYSVYSFVIKFVVGLNSRLIYIRYPLYIKEKEIMKSSNPINNQKGFTLIEIIAVLILLGILAAVAVPKYMDLTDNAKQKAVDAGIAELNSRESLAWGKLKLTSTGWVTDAATFATIDTNLNSTGETTYAWTTAASVTGGSLQFQGATTVVLTRVASDVNTPGHWKR